MHRLSAFLILLLLFNSSLALEVLIHDSHQHAAVEADQQGVHGMHGSADVVEPAEAADGAHDAEDCLCDDICCLSSIDFGLALNGHDLPLDGDSPVTNPNFYRSISLDLFLPPPTA
mgnify:CR=1 FL=1